MDSGHKINCRATAIKQQKSMTAAIMIESEGARESVSVSGSKEFHVSVGDRISCLIGTVAVSVPEKPNIVLFTLSSQPMSQTELVDAPMASPNKIIIGERIFRVMRILSNA